MARLISRTQVEEQRNFSRDSTFEKSVTISGSLVSDGSFKLGSDPTVKSEITGSIGISGSLSIDGDINFSGQSFTSATASYAMDSELFGGISPNEFGAMDGTIYVSSTSGDDTNDGRSPQFPVKTVKKAADIVTAGDDGRFGLDTGSLYSGYQIQVSAGTYLEDNPVTLPKNTTVWGSGLRVTKILGKNKNKDLFWVNSGNYLAEMTFGRLQVYPSVDDSQTGFAIAFAPNAFITTSPYIQNCSMISNQENSFLESYEKIPAGGGGINVNGNAVNRDSPLCSMVLDAYTQVSPNGVGCQVIGRGFIQLVSFFTNFSAYSVKVLDGGQAVLLNSNTSFGDYGMYSSGSRFITGSGGNIEAFTRVRDNYSIIINTIEEGTGSLPEFVPNTEYSVKVTDELQQFSNEISSEEVAEQAKSEYRLVSNIIENGTLNTPALLAKSSKEGYSTGSVWNISDTEQITGSLTITSTELDIFKDKFNKIEELLTRGQSVTALYNQISNIQNLRKETYLSQFGSVNNTTEVEINYTKTNLETILNLVRYGEDNNETPIPPLTSSITNNIKVSELEQFVTDIPSSIEVQEVVNSLLSTITTIYQSGSEHTINQIDNDNVEDISIDYQNTYSLLINNSLFIQEEVTLYIASSYINSGFDIDNSKQNIKDIIDAISYDLLYGGNQQTIQLGLNKNTSKPQSDIKKVQFLDSVEHIKDIINSILNDIRFVEPSIDVENGYQLLTNNRTFIQDEVDSYISFAWKSSEYEPVIRGVDIGDIIDSISTDLRYGGNQRSLQTAKRLREKSVIANNFEYLELTDTLIRTRDLCIESISKNQLVPISPKRKDIYNLIISNRDFILTEIINYVNTQFSNLVYSTTEFKRNVGLIIDSILTDLLYEGNQQTISIGVSYGETPIKLDKDILNETLKAISYSETFIYKIINDVIIDVPSIITNTDNKIFTEDVSPITSSTPVSEIEIDKVKTSSNLLKEIISTGNTSDDFNLIYNTDNSIKVSDIEPVTSSVIINNSYQNKVEESFNLITDIISNGFVNSNQITSSVDGLIKINDIEQYTSSESGSSDDKVQISRGIGFINDIIEYGDGGVPFSLFKWFNTNNDIPSNISTDSYTTLSEDYALDTQLNLINVSFNSIIDSIDNQTPIQVSTTKNGSNNIKVTNETQYISSITDPTDEIYKLNSNISVIKNGLTGSIIPNNSDKDNLIQTTGVNQFITQETGGRLEQRLISSSISLIINEIELETSSLSTVEPYGDMSDSTDTIAANNLLTSNISFIQEETISYISSSWGNLNYDEANCKEQISSIVLGIADDIIHNSVSQSVSLAETYSNQPIIAINDTNIINDYSLELNPTTDIIKYVGRLSENIARGYTYGTANGDILEATKILRNNQTFIVKEVNMFVSTALSHISFNDNNYEKYVKFILNSITTDLAYGGNQRSKLIYDSYDTYLATDSLGATLNVSQKDELISLTLDYINTLITKLLNGIKLNTISDKNKYVYDTLTLNREFIKKELSLFSEARNSKQFYENELYSNYISNLVDSVLTDVIWGGNERVKKLSQDYYLSDLENIVRTSVYSNDFINTILNKEELQLLDITSNGTTELTEVSASVDLLSNNKNFIQTETISYLNSIMDGVNYDTTVISGNIELTINGIITDLQYTGNESLKSTAESINSNTTSSEKSVMITALDYVMGVSNQIIGGDTRSIVPNKALITNELILDNKLLIQTETNNYIASSWSDSDYTITECIRDIELVVNAVVTDLLYGGNQHSLTLGNKLRKDSTTLTNNRKTQLVQAIEYANSLTMKLLKNTSFNQPTIETNTSVDLIKDNKIFIKNETLSFLSTLFSDREYDTNELSNYIKHIVDTITTDLLYGGNQRSTEVGLSYTVDMFDNNSGIIIDNNQSEIVLTSLDFIDGTIRNVIQSLNYTKPSTEITNGISLLKTNTEFIQKETNAYLQSSWSQLQFDKQELNKTIYRIIDTVITDIKYGGNQRAIVAGTKYYNTPLTSITKPQLRDCINFIKGLSEKIINQIQLVYPFILNLEGANALRKEKPILQDKAISYTNRAFPDFEYDESKCYRDTGYIVDALVTDTIYGGNERSIIAAKAYYDGVYGDAGIVIENQNKETAETNRYLRTQAQLVARQAPTVEFGSLIITTAHDFSYAGAGVTYKALPPNQGGDGVPDPSKEIVELGGGRVFFTSGNELGDFRIGSGLVIEQASGTLKGRVFSKSLFSLVTPFSLALQD